MTSSGLLQERQVFSRIGYERIRARSGPVEETTAARRLSHAAVVRFVTRPDLPSQAAEISPTAG
jgi:hypothetical protein